MRNNWIAHFNNFVENDIKFLNNPKTHTIIPKSTLEDIANCVKLEVERSDYEARQPNYYRALTTSGSFNLINYANNLKNKMNVIYSQQQVLNQHMIKSK